MPTELLTGLHSRSSALHGLLAQWSWAGFGLVLLAFTWRHAMKRFQAYGG